MPYSSRRNFIHISGLTTIQLGGAIALGRDLSSGSKSSRSANSAAALRKVRSFINKYASQSFLFGECALNAKLNKPQSSFHILVDAEDQQTLIKLLQNGKIPFPRIQVDGNQIHIKTEGTHLLVENLNSVAFQARVSKILDQGHHTRKKGPSFQHEHVLYDLSNRSIHDPHRCLQKKEAVLNLASGSTNALNLEAILDAHLFAKRFESKIPTSINNRLKKILKEDVNEEQIAHQTAMAFSARLSALVNELDVDFVTKIIKSTYLKSAFSQGLRTDISQTVQIAKHLEKNAYETHDSKICSWLASFLSVTEDYDSYGDLHNAFLDSTTLSYRMESPTWIKKATTLI